MNYNWAVNWEDMITVLTEKWERLTRGWKPLFVEVTTYWPAGEPLKHNVYLSCYQYGRQEVKSFNSTEDAQEWLVEQLTDMLEEEFRRQYAEQEQTETKEEENDDDS
jgi:hypothetical protein